MTCHRSFMKLFRYGVAFLVVLCLVSVLASEEDQLIVKVETPADSSGGIAAAPPPGNSTDSKGSKTIADVIDQALKKEFDGDTKQLEQQAGKSFNESVSKDEGQLETVVRISGHKDDASTTATNTTDKPTAPATGKAPVDDDALPVVVSEKTPASIPKFASTVDRIIDSKDNEFVLSSSKDNFAGLTLDPQLIQDLTFVLTASAVMGMLFESLKQPVINGYLVAGALVGPGGLKLIKELVQVESLAQLGVELLLFSIGLELNFGRLRQIWGVAIIGGALQIFGSITIVAVLAVLSGAALNQGIFVGALLSMSSTSVVVKCLEMSKALNTTYGQITMGTLILQDCSVGLMFALMPVLRPASTPLADTDVAEQKAAVAIMVIQVLIKLIVALCLVALIARTVLPTLLSLLKTHASRELVQLTLVGICLITAWISGHFGLSEELGAFLAGAMISVAEPISQEQTAHSTAQRHTFQYVESVTNVLTALFISSIGLIMSPLFLMEHIVVLTAGVVVVTVGKTLLVGGIVNMFGVPYKTSFAVGVSLAHIGEFAFVLLSMAYQHKLLPQQERMLLLGVTGLSLLSAPIAMHLASKLPTGPNLKVRRSEDLPSGFPSAATELHTSLLVGVDEDADVVRPGVHATHGSNGFVAAQHTGRFDGQHPAAEA